MLSVVLLATTILFREKLPDTPYTPHPFPSGVETVMSADELTEFAGRSVHGSWDRNSGPYPNATNRAYLRWLLDLDYPSLFEHASATMWVTGGSFALSADLHSLAPYLHITEASLRYRNLDNVKGTIPAAVAYDDGLESDYKDAFEEAHYDAADLDSELTSRGFVPETARDAAIGLLPMSTETTLLISADLNGWRYLIEQSQAAESSAELYSLGSQALMELEQFAPNAVQDLRIGRRLRPVPDAQNEPLEAYSECG